MRSYRGKMVEKRGNGRTLAPAISLAGLVVDTEIAGNFFSNVCVGIGDCKSGFKNPLRQCAFRIESNQMVCTLARTETGQPAAQRVLGNHFGRNFVLSPFGFFLVGLGST